MSDGKSRPDEKPETAWVGMRCVHWAGPFTWRAWRLGALLGLPAWFVWLLASGSGRMEEIGPADLVECLPAGQCQPAMRKPPVTVAWSDRATGPARRGPIRLVGMMTDDSWASPASTRSLFSDQAEDAPSDLGKFPQLDSGPLLRRLPPVEAQPAAKPAGYSVVAADLPLVSLLPPQPCTAKDSTSESVAPEDAPEATWRNISDADAALFTGVRTGTKIHDQALAKIQQGYLLADRHAFYAARQEFIQVLRMVSRALGAKEGTTERTTDLASGLRALEEAGDFVPRGTGLEADLNVSIIASAHRTPVAQDLPLQQWLPQQLMDRYFRYAQLKLAAAVAGNPDGSIALHALGKLQRRLGRLEPRTHRLAHRQAFAFQQAALLAHPFNHLAAHELGVLLADGGRYQEAECLLQQVAAKEPHPVVLGNLAQVQYKLGHTGQAAENDQRAQQLAVKPGVAGRRVQWVSPTEFASATDATTFGLPTQPWAGSSTASEGRINASPGLALGSEAAQGLPAAAATRENKSFWGLRNLLPHPLPAHSARVPASPSYPSRPQGVR